MQSDIQQPSALLALIEQHQLMQGKPCAVCRCELYRTNMYLVAGASLREVLFSTPLSTQESEMYEF